MNIYVKTINDAVEYIESRLEDKLTLTSLAQQFHISDFHFNRMFKTITGITLKQYILGRKLTKAAELLKKTNEPILEIALDLSFDYPEVFSRAFKKQYKISPAKFRVSPQEIEGVSKACILERDIVNYGGSLSVKGKCVYLEEFPLTGVSLRTNVYRKDFREKLEASSGDFVLQSYKMPQLNQEQYYTVVNCDGEDTGDYTVFCGRRLIDGGSADTGPTDTGAFQNLQKRLIPAGWYVSFRYCGDMFDIREKFEDELYRWILIKEAQLNPNGIGMLNIYPQDYPLSHTVELLVPIKEPV